MFEPLLASADDAFDQFKNVLAYLTFERPQDPSGTVYEAVKKQVIATSIQKSLVNSVDGIRAVGQFNASETANFDIGTPLGRGDFTVETRCRIATADLTGVYVAVSNQNNSSGVVSNVDRISIGSNAGKLYTPTSYGSNHTTTANVPGNAHAHWCIQRFDNMSYVYLDGVLVNSFTHQGSINLTAFCLGAYFSGSRRFFKGQIAEVAISNAARYPVEGFMPTYPLFDLSKT